MSSSSQLHYSNLLLPSIEREGLSEDEKQSNRKIQALVEKTKQLKNTQSTQGKSSPFGLFEDLCLALRQHRALKFQFSENLRLEVFNALLPLYLQDSQILSYPNRTVILQLLRQMLRKSWSRLPIILDWRPFWQELLDMVHREHRYESNCAMNVFINHRDTLTAFLFNCRHYFDPITPSPSYPLPELQTNLIDYAMNLLSNIRVMSCVEGLLALVFCLPNHFSQFDVYLSQWLQLWSMIDNNQVWDFCWIVLLCRATKHPVASKSFAWQSLVPFLLTKAKYVLGITPSVQSDSFPKGIPSYYQQLLIMWNDMDAKATTKFTKVLFHAIMCDSTSTPLAKASITPPNLVMEALRGYLESHPTQSFPALTDEVVTVKATVLTLCQFFQTIRPCFHPSNTQPNSILIARLIEVLLRCITKNIATEVGKKLVTLKTTGSNATPDGGAAIDPLTWNTYQYLQGYCFLILVESMNSTNFLLQGINAISVNHLISVNPLFIHLLTPFLLDALEPKSISQPQRILSALNIFSSNMRTMLYPNPVVLQYLPSLLRLSLTGLDPADAQKSLDTMDLFTHIFYWIPIHPASESETLLANNQSSAVLPVGSYSNLLSLQSASPSVISRVEIVDIQTHSAALVQYLTTEWIYEYLDRIFVLIEGLDKGTTENGLEISDLLYKIIYCNSIIFQAMIAPSSSANREGGDDSFALAIEEKILQYILREASSHVAKISGKLIVSIVANRPHRFPEILNKILDEEMLTATASEEKMRYRLQLAAACSRMTLNEYALPTIQSLFAEGGLLRYDKRYLYHKELKVRKAYVKWMKDVMRGLGAIYPIDIRPPSTAINMTSIASPVIPEPDFMSWNIPSVKTLRFIIDFLQYMTSKIQEEILFALDTALTSSSEATTTEEKLTAKKCEEMIGANLSLLTKLLRGGAELFGDRLVNTTNPSDPANWCLHTGREVLISQLPVEEQLYLCNYRHSLLQFLGTIMNKIRNIPESSPYYVLHNHSILAGLWMRVFYLVVARRVSFLKNPEAGIQGHNYQKLTDDSVLSRTIYEYLKFSSSSPPPAFSAVLSASENSIVSPAFLNRLCDINYWKFHDRSLNWIALKAWYQRSVRGHMYAYNSIQTVHAPSSSSNEFLNCLEELYYFGSHVYDSISVQGTKLYAQMTLLCAPTLFSSIMTRFFDRLYTTTTSASLSYYELVAILEISKAIGVLSRWTCSLSLRLQFFQAMPRIITAISRIEDLEKMQLANLSLSDLFSLYAMTWNHTIEELRSSQEQLLPIIFQSTIFGRLFLEQEEAEREGEKVVAVSENPPLMDEEELAVTTTTTVNHNRSDILLAYLLLHLIDPSLLEERISLSVWKRLWRATLHYLSLDHYHPLQPIFETIAIRLIEIIFIFYQDQKAKSQLDLLATHEKYQFVKELFAMNSLQWTRLLYGLVHSRAVIISAEEEEQEDDGAGGTGGGGGGLAGGGAFHRPGWATELETIAHATEYLKIVKTRWFTAKMFEYNLSSDYFRKEMAAAMYSLVASEVLVCLENEQSLTDFLALWKQLPVVNESEKKSSNYLQSELFGGLYRAFLQQRTEKESEKEEERERYDRLEAVFCHFLCQEILETIPLEYGRDWQEAISFALEDTKVEKLGRIQEELIQRFRQAVQETSRGTLHSEVMLTDEEEEDEGDDENEEGEEDVEMEEVDEEIEEMHIEEDNQEDGEEDREDMETEDNNLDDDDLAPDTTAGGEGGVSTKTTTTASVTLDEGFARRSIIYMFTFGLLNGDCIARVTTNTSSSKAKKTTTTTTTNPVFPCELLVAKEILQILIDPETNVLSPYYTSRYEFASIINTLIDFFSYQAYYYPHPENPTAVLPGEVDPPAYYLLLPLLYDKITSGVRLPTSVSLEPTTTTAVEKLEGIKLTSASSGEESLSSRLFVQTDEDRSSSPPRKKTMLFAPSSAIATTGTVATVGFNTAFLQSWDQQSLASHSGDPVPFSYSTDSSTLLGPPIAPTNTLSKSVSFDYSIANEGGRNTTTTATTSSSLQAMMRSTDSNDNLSVFAKPPKVPVSNKNPESQVLPPLSSTTTPAASTGITVMPAALTDSRQQLHLKQTIDTIQHILQDIIRWIPIQWISPALHAFFPVLIQGLIHSEVEVINKSAEALMMIVSGLFPTHYLPSHCAGAPGEESHDFHQGWIDQFQSLYQVYSFSWKIKAMIIQLSLTFLTQQWFYLSTMQRQSIKTLFMNGIKDEQLNIRGIAASGMICYLAFKTPQELTEIAELYTRNSEKLATREKNRRRKLKSLSRESQDSNDSMMTGIHTTMTQSTTSSTGAMVSMSNSSIPDSDYMLNIQMMSCLILTRSYDLPPYLPKLITTFLRHRYYYDINKLIITKTIQMFQETHHDRWEEYQLQFTTEQLMELQGVGAAYYFA